MFLLKVVAPLGNEHCTHLRLVVVVVVVRRILAKKRIQEDYRVLNFSSSFWLLVSIAIIFCSMVVCNVPIPSSSWETEASTWVAPRSNSESLLPKVDACWCRLLSCCSLS